MLKVSPEQLAACAEVSTQSFAQRITRHLTETLPAQAQAMGLSALQGMVEKGIASALSHGITAKKDVTLFLAATAALGEGFDTKLKWASDLLGPQNPLGAGAKVQQLWTTIEPDLSADGASQNDVAEPSAALAMELSEVAKTALAGPLPVNKPLVPCPLRPRTYPFSL